jgi:hypothetical protein
MTFKITPGEPIIPSESINATASTMASPASIHGLDFFCLHDLSFSLQHK